MLDGRDGENNGDGICTLGLMIEAQADFGRMTSFLQLSIQSKLTRNKKVREYDEDLKCKDASRKQGTPRYRKLFAAEIYKWY